jgi:hypothetical protein
LSGGKGGSVAAAVDKECITKLVERLRSLTRMKSLIDTDSTTTISTIIAFDTERYFVEERIIHLQGLFSTTSSTGFREQFLATWCIAISIYVCVCFRNFHPRFPILGTLKRDLMGAIEKMEYAYGCLKEIPGSNTPYAETLLWALFIGGTLALDESETTWFAHRIIEVIPWTPVTSFADLDACFKRILWYEKLHNTAFLSLWNKVAATLGLENVKDEKKKSAVV